MSVSGAKWWKVVDFHNFHQVFHSGVGENQKPVEKPQTLPKQGGDRDMMLYGRFEHNMDAKGRVFVPVKLREKLGETFIAA